MKILDDFHSTQIFKRRVKVLSTLIASRVPQGARILDVGAGDGLISNLVKSKTSDTSVEGVDVLVRENTHIPIKQFDGIHLPYPSNSFDVVTFVDVLHHTHNQKELLEEAKRVSKKLILIKDHNSDGFLGETTLKFMDDVGNKKHGVALPYVYLNKTQWEKLFEGLSLKIMQWEKHIGLYPFPLNLAFDRELHVFVTLSV
ncbi:MAG: methyltransferase domain-containing protein [Cyanobacteria bacterium P01_H01_bin.105]